MCGVAGVVTSPAVGADQFRQRLLSMVNAMAARGPDDCGIHVANTLGVGLANRRLSVRDLSDAGHMPMGNADGSVWITYNGELYNARELRSDLESLGYRFASTSDTEVILHGYEAWNRGVVHRMRGMFAFAVLDCRVLGDESGQDHGPRLLLARDPLGIKPLYYSCQNGTFCFASECKALLASGLVSHELSPAGLVAYLQSGSVPAPLTIYRDIRALEAGHLLSVACDAEGAACRPRERYWWLPTHTEPAYSSYVEAVERVRELLLDSVRRHLISDVPLGVFLSGGLDSASIVALMRLLDPLGVIVTCSMGFDEPDYDERPYAREVAARFQTNHVEVRLGARDVLTALDHFLESLDQPSTDGINTYFVSRTARQNGLTVALSGLGSDELFGGYPTFQRLGRLSQAVELTRSIHGGRALGGALRRAFGPYHGAARIADWVESSEPAVAAAYLGLRGVFSLQKVRDLVRPEVQEIAERERAAVFCGGVPDSDGRDPWDLASRLELTSYMRHQLLRDVDVMSMAHSLEVRVPFVDLDVVEGVLRLPVDVRRSARPKQLLCDAVPWLPPRVRDRHKQGFNLPLAKWMRGPLRPRVNDLVQAISSELRAYLRPGACQDVVQAFEAGRAASSRPWALLALGSTLKHSI